MPTTNKYARHSAPRKASDAPLTVEVLSCQGGMAMSRFDFTEAYRIFQLLLQRYGEAKYDAERIRVLEALYHTTGYEARGHMSWQQQCHQMFDDLVTKKLPDTMDVPRSTNSMCAAASSKVCLCSCAVSMPTCRHMLPHIEPCAA